jgi:hypothetical protein
MRGRGEGGDRDGRSQKLAAQRVMAEYRLQLFGRGESRGLTEDGRPMRLGVSEQRIEEVVAKKGRLEKWEAVRCRVRYFSDGLILGSREFVERYFKKHRRRFGPKRESGARAMRYVELRELFTMRDLQKMPIG